MRAVKSYLIIEKGLIEDRVFPVEKQVTIGRNPDNTIQLTDPNVSKRHALVYLIGDQAVVEDLGSQTGTFVNREQITKAILSNGDTLQVGNVTFRFFQKEIPKKQSWLADILKANQPENSVRLDEGIYLPPEMRHAVRYSPFFERIPRGRNFSRRSHMLIKPLSEVPLFSSLNKEDLARISQVARLMVFDQGRTIIQQGDRGKSLYIILDGTVLVFTYYYPASKVLLAILSENQFFGEIAFLTGAPRSATVKALEKTLLCELSFEAMREIVQRSPIVKDILEQCARERINDLEAKKRAAGLVEQRRHQRFVLKLPVSFSVSSTSKVPDQVRGKLFQSISQNISISGIRIKVQDRSLLWLPMGCKLRLEIHLPRPWGPIRCLGTLRNIFEGKRGQEFACLGIEFTEMPQAYRKKLVYFLCS